MKPLVRLLFFLLRGWNGLNTGLGMQESNQKNPAGIIVVSGALNLTGMDDTVFLLSRLAAIRKLA
jgi:hypothetical protein